MYFELCVSQKIFEMPINKIDKIWLIKPLVSALLGVTLNDSSKIGIKNLIFDHITTNCFYLNHLTQFIHFHQLIPALSKTQKILKLFIFIAQASATAYKRSNPSFYNRLLHNLIHPISYNYVDQTLNMSENQLSIQEHQSGEQNKSVFAKNMHTLLLHEKAVDSNSFERQQKQRKQNQQEQRHKQSQQQYIDGILQEAKKSAIAKLAKKAKHPKKNGVLHSSANEKEGQILLPTSKHRRKQQQHVNQISRLPKASDSANQKLTAGPSRLSSQNSYQSRFRNYNDGLNNSISQIERICNQRLGGFQAVKAEMSRHSLTKEQLVRYYASRINRNFAIELPKVRDNSKEKSIKTQRSGLSSRYNNKNPQNNLEFQKRKKKLSQQQPKSSSVKALKPTTNKVLQSRSRQNGNMCDSAKNLNVKQQGTLNTTKLRHKSLSFNKYYVNPEQRFRPRVQKKNQNNWNTNDGIHKIIQENVVTSKAFKLPSILSQMEDKKKLKHIQNLAQEIENKHKRRPIFCKHFD